MIYNISALGDINDDKELWGGKAVSISQLIKNGFKVPKGLVISTTVHQHFLGNQISVDSFELKLSGIYLSNIFGIEAKFLRFPEQLTRPSISAS